MLEVEVTLDRQRILRYDWPAFAAMDRTFRASYGRSTVQLIRDVGESIREDFDILQTLVWGGLRHRDRKLTPDDVGLLLSAYATKGGDSDELWGKVIEAFNGSGLFKTPENGGPPADPTPAATEPPG